MLAGLFELSEVLRLLAADCETEELEPLAADCEFKSTNEDEAAEDVLIKLTLLDLVLETTDPDEELAACAEAAYRLTSVVSNSLA